MGYATAYKKEHLEAILVGLRALPNNHVVALDCETSGLAPLHDRVVGIGLSWAEGDAFYIPTWTTDENCELAFTDCIPVLEELKRLRVIAHKWTFDSTMVYTSFGIALPCWDDTYLLAKLLCFPMGLDGLMTQLFHVPADDIKDFKKLMVHHFGVNWKSKGHRAAELPLGQEEWSVDRYCCGDADYCRRSYFQLKPLLKKNNLASLHKIEVNTLPLARKLNLTGVPVDPTSMEIACTQVEAENLRMEEKIYELAGERFKINSPRDAPRIIFEKLGLPVILRSRQTGAPSLKKEVMEQLEGLHPIIEVMSEWKADTRMVNSYLKKLPAEAKADPTKRSRIYTEFNPLGAVSGRWTSSSNEDLDGEDHGTNLQNQSKKVYEWVENGEQKKASVRMAYVAPPGWTWVRFDFDQVEPRVQASLSQEPFLLDNFRKGIDSHTTTTMVCFDMSEDEVRADTKAGGSMRKKGKILNLAMGYGMGEDKLARSLHCSKAEAVQRLERYWVKLPRVAAIIKASQEDLIRTNQIRTFFGRLRIIDMAFLKKHAHYEYDSALRKAWNTKSQGTAAEILKIAMLRVASAMKPFKKDVELTLTVHDELDFLVRNEILFDALPPLRRAFEVPAPPDWAEFVASVGYGPNWDELSHTEYTERNPEPFVSWSKTIPPEYVSHVEPEEELLAA